MFTHKAQQFCNTCCGGLGQPWPSPLALLVGLALALAHAVVQLRISPHLTIKLPSCGGQRLTFAVKRQKYLYFCVFNIDIII